MVNHCVYHKLYGEADIAICTYSLVTKLHHLAEICIVFMGHPLPVQLVVDVSHPPLGVQFCHQRNRQEAGRQLRLV